MSPDQIEYNAGVMWSSHQFLTFETVIWLLLRNITSSLWFTSSGQCFLFHAVCELNQGPLTN